ncbi:MAG: methylated-DNA--[protein]-cysteine S-methyltransferase [Ignavibacteria bacterium]|jgi:methylated-DNA-[protein]-cysteine S-methyltransferase|nr:methylated-DNA--[protein]-cysteine S-methyltransferase [Ignavibacteria bacterium]
MINKAFYHTKLGTLQICCSDSAITSVNFATKNDNTAKSFPNDLSEEAILQIREYLEQKRQVFSLPLHFEGTEFQKSVWRVLQSIPFGETRSYKDIACAIGNSKASRAVGMANNRNPIAIIIPCHRVIGSNGKMVGYAGGLDVKRKLLEIEGIFL